MDFISYRGVQFTILRTLAGWQRESQFDASGTSYLWTRWRGSFVVTYSPAATAYLPGNPPVTPAGGFNPLTPVFPVVTDTAIREFLQQPRGQLLIRSNGRVLLMAPAAPAPCDCNNGPKITVHSISEVLSERTWNIAITVEAAIREDTGVAPFAIVSNRWSQTADVALPNYLTRRITVGTVHARSDVLRATNTPLDAMRAQFMAFSCPVGWQRHSVHVVSEPDGNTCHYSLIDEQKMFPHSANVPAPRIEYTDANWVSHGSWGRAVANFFREWNRTRSIVEPIPNPAFPNTINVAIGAIAAELPKRYKTVIARAWGLPTTDRKILVDLALSIAAARVGPMAVFDTTTAEVIVQADTNNYVQVTWTARWDFATVATIGGPMGLIAAAAQFTVPGAIGGPGDADWANSIFANPDTAVTTGQQGIPIKICQTPIAMPQLPSGINTGGATPTWLGVLVTQALEPFCTAPASPP